jgi:hypothetical protein
LDERSFLFGCEEIVINERLMKTTAILIGCLLVLFMACETHGPLKGIWKEANESLLGCVIFHNDVDTLNLHASLPSNSSPDSVLVMGFSVFRMKEGPGMYQLIQKQTKRNLHPIRIWKEGKCITLMGIHQASLDTLVPKALKTKGMLNNRLLFDCTGRPSELYVLWQNVQLPKSFFVFTKEGFTTLIPIEAKSMEHSVLRIFAVSDSLIVFDSRVNLLYGQPQL